jgi:hypothetical protein
MIVSLKPDTEGSSPKHVNFFEEHESINVNVTDLR